MKETHFVTNGFYPRKHGSEICPRKLAKGILGQALRDAFTPPRHMEEREWQREALRWFLCQKDFAGSLNWVCQILGLEPAVIRELLRPDQIVLFEGTSRFLEKD